mgnify:FL=1
MTDTPNYKDTIFLPKTDFPMRAGLPKKEPEILARWEEIDLYSRLRDTAKGRDKFILHDGPPYANGHLHIGHALNKTLKDMVTRTQQMLGKDSNYVPGWDCHGLPIEWKIEEQYRAKGLDKDQVPVNDFRKECREFADHWIDVQREEFKRLGVTGDWKRPYTTMSFDAEAQIARELMTFAMTGQLYRGSKPVMWSVVEKTALAEAEVEYHDHVSDTIWVKFPVVEGADAFSGANVVIWTTTPWTIPGNRAISYSPRIAYGLYEVTDAPAENWLKTGEKLILADALAADVMKQARVTAFARRADVTAADLAAITCAHPLRGKGYDFDVPMLAGDHVTDEAGTGFVHTAPGHGREDFDVWMEHRAQLEARGIPTVIPYTVDAEGRFTKDAPGFEGAQVITHKGDKGDANKVVIDALAAAGMMVARGRLTHSYPHSWRSKKPVIFRNTPQWFVYMDRDIDGPGDTLRARALAAIDATRFVPASGQNRLRGMIAERPDWVLSRQRAWGVPITVFADPDTGEVLKNEAVNARIADAFEAEGADAWFRDDAKARFLSGLVDDPDRWMKVTDILDVWFDSGSTHSYVLDRREDLKPHRIVDGGRDRVLYLEGSDQHRGWFHSSLLESCGTRGRAPYDSVLTHGFVLDEQGRKMSKSLGNTVAPQDVVKESGADILRLWVAFSDYSEDLRIGPEILKSNVDAYRRLRNTVRWLLGALDGFSEAERLPVAEMPELERWVLHRLWQLDALVRQGFDDFAFQRVYHQLFTFATNDLSSVYFDIRKDALYCDAAGSVRRRACRTVLDHVFHCLVRWFAPVLVFTMEEAWLTRFPSETGSVHLQTLVDVPAEWRDDALAEKWAKVRRVRRVVTGALEVERAAKRIGASLEAAPVIHIADADLRAAVEGVDMAELCIASAATIVAGEGPADAFRMAEVPGVAVVPALAEGQKCARCWQVLPDVGTHAHAPGTCGRCADAVGRDAA